jgi:glycosyltransferase involved in cell wall biosynthesis
MRILMIAHSISTWTPQFANYFKSRGDDVVVATFSPNKIEGINTEFIGIEPFDPFKNKYIFFTRVPRLRKIIRIFKPDIVFAIYLSSNGLSGALAWKGPFVVSAVGSDVLDRFRRTGLRRIFRESIIKLVCRKADIINTVSQGIDDELLRLGVPQSKLLQIPFSVNFEQFYPDPAMPRTDAATFICTRRHEPIYDIVTIIEALGLMKLAGRQFHCILTSGGTLLETHKQKVIDAGLENNVTFTGFLEHGELPKLLRSADIYISASLGDGTSVSLMEAMATGLLPVVSNIDANKPWITDGKTGLLFETKNPQSLVKALNKALDDSVLRQNAFDKNRERIARDGDMQKNMKMLADIFEKLVMKKKYH